MIHQNKKQWMSVAEVADELRMDRKTIYLAIKEGRLKAVRPGGGNMFRIDRVQLQHFINGMDGFVG